MTLRTTFLFGVSGAVSGIAAIFAFILLGKLIPYFDSSYYFFAIGPMFGIIFALCMMYPLRKLGNSWTRVLSVFIASLLSFSAHVGITFSLIALFLGEFGIVALFIGGFTGALILYLSTLKANSPGKLLHGILFPLAGGLVVLALGWLPFVYSPIIWQTVIAIYLGYLFSRTAKTSEAAVGVSPALP